MFEKQCYETTLTWLLRRLTKSFKKYNQELNKTMSLHRINFMIQQIKGFTNPNQSYWCPYTNTFPFKIKLRILLQEPLGCERNIVSKKVKEKFLSTWFENNSKSKLGTQITESVRILFKWCCSLTSGSFNNAWFISDLWNQWCETPQVLQTWFENNSKSKLGLKNL